MAKYKKKPIVVEAVQWTGGAARAAQIEALDAGRNKISFIGIPPHEVSIETLEGTMKACFLDWIIKGVQGELYPCKPDIFEQTYELVEPSPNPRRIDFRRMNDAANKMDIRAQP